MLLHYLIHDIPFLLTHLLFRDPGGGIAGVILDHLLIQLGRGLRLVHTHLRGESLTRDDLTDLALLRLDAVAAITVDAAGRAGKLFVARKEGETAARKKAPRRK